MTNLTTSNTVSGVTYATKEEADRARATEEFVSNSVMDFLLKSTGK